MEHPLNPLASASWFSQLFFNWAWPLLRKKGNIGAGTL